MSDGPRETLPDASHDAARSAGGQPSRIGRFAVLRKQGSGGMGVVYAGYDEQLDRKVAIKLLHADVTEESVGRARLVREAQAMAKVSHPNVAHVYEVGEHDGRVYVVMQFIDGAELGAWSDLDRPWTEVLDAYVQAGRGLAAAHEAGLVHRDFKPGNVMITASGHVRVLDFGLASYLDERMPTVRDAMSPEDLEALESLRTRTGALVGTPAYMAPEVLGGGRADAASDQFAFCVSLFEGLYGVHPFGKLHGAARLVAILAAEPPARPESDAPGWLFRVLLRGLSRDPIDRFASMHVLLREVEARRAPNRTRLGLVALTGVSTVVAVAAFTSTPGESSADPCPRRPDALGDAWSEARQRDVSAAFDAVDAVYAAQTFTQLESALDHYAEAWLDEAHDSCVATRVQAVQSERAFDARAACLSDLRTALGEVTQLLVEADQGIVDKSEHLLAGLKPPGICADVEALVAIPPPPPEHAGAVREIKATMARAAALDSAGRWKEALPLARSALARVEGIDYGPASVQVQFQVGNIASHAGELDEALLHVRGSYFRALAGADRFSAGRAATKLVDLHVARSELPAAHEWLRHASAQHDGLGDAAAGLRLDHLIAEARLAQEEARLVDATDVLTRARDLADQHGLNKRGLYDALGTVHLWRGQWSDALATYRANVDLCRAAVGSEHPNCITAEGNLGFALLKKGDIEGARATFDDVLTRARMVFPDGLAQLDAILNNAAGAYEREGLFDAARDMFLEVHEIRVDKYGAEHPLTAHPLNNLGNVYVSQENWDEAERYFSQAHAILEKAHGPAHFHVSFPLHGLGQVARGREDFETAVTHFARVVEIRDVAESSPEGRAAAWMELAEARAELPGQKEQARTDALAAKAILAAATDEGEDLIDIRYEVDRWLAEHPA